ncbi:hypothetical protein FK513_32470 [Klebsiella pneumoniae]|nr:hypothetical protein [Klebsiella pneumoniae]
MGWFDNAERHRNGEHNGRTLPYPPGVPLLMPGEMITEESRQPAAKHSGVAPGSSPTIPHLPRR